MSDKAGYKITSLLTSMEDENPSKFKCDYSFLLEYISWKEKLKSLIHKEKQMNVSGHSCKKMQYNKPSKNCYKYKTTFTLPCISSGWLGAG